MKDHLELSVDEDADVFYLERDEIPGICTEVGKTASWTPPRFKKSYYRAATSDTSEHDVDINDCMCIEYQPVSGVLGFEITTKDETFWAPIVHRTCTRLKYADNC